MALVALAPLAVVACGDGSDASETGSGGSGGDTIQVSMTDNEFTPNVFTVEAGKAVTFRLTNDGSVTHEAVIGTEAEQKAHDRVMREMTTTTTADGSESDGSGSDGSGGGGTSGDTTTTTDHDMGEMHHLRSHDSDLPGVTVEPGESKDLVYIFDAPGKVLIGCHEPGHYDDGMKATVTVT
jgi:uncharacterized cupredoxin-like copper-binding protein